MSWLGNLLRGGADELGWDDLIRRIVDAIWALKRFGARGEVVLPADVIVRIEVGGGSIDVIQGFVDRPELDREVAAALANRCDVPLDQLPVREYAVIPAERTRIIASEGPPRTWQVTIDGGDLSGRTLVFPPGWAEAAFGRGAWHGEEHGARNDLVVCERTGFVSRRAGRLYRAGHQVEVVALDQGDQLVVRRSSGETVRPARTARARVAMRAGDAIELWDGRENRVSLVLQHVVE